MPRVVWSFVLLLIVAGRLPAQNPALTLDVWPGKAPGEMRDSAEEKGRPEKSPVGPIRLLTEVTKPTLAVYRPAADKDTGAAVLICPGGGYNVLALDLEGEEVAIWLNTIGVTGIVLKYRVPRRKDVPPHEMPLQDAQRALSLVRTRAQEWKLDPRRLGILGFSAGGNLAAIAANHFDKRGYEALDDVDKQSCRPDFAVLIYPAYLSEKDGSLAPQLTVTKQSPPTFFAHAGDDGIGPENSIVLYQALRKAGVASELHVYARGGHGFGLRPTEQPASRWPQRCEEWLRGQGILRARGAE
jgi:acetyl esterase/lipase